MTKREAQRAAVAAEARRRRVAVLKMRSRVRDVQRKCPGCGQLVNKRHQCPGAPR